ncbi:olfactory receptor 13H1-like [Pseudophryne corroboree]|uniref:olfactory receptor 13H1-like n=1 Tax=Pseudophryne corroboree TaxID=495146 RepID=UPI0030814417
MPLHFNKVTQFLLLLLQRCKLLIVICNMEFGNQTFLNYFILIGLPQNLQISVLLFFVFILIYTLTVVGNSFLICAIIISPKLHTPMYYFLCNLAFIDLSYPSSTLPKMLLDMFSKRRTISIIGCLTQMNTTLFLGSTLCILLAVMAYDRYIAIRFPLHYAEIMNWRTCKIITVILWSGSFLVATMPIIARPLVFCRENILDHFACEVLVLLEVACGDLSFYKITMFVASLFTLVTPFIFIVVSYICILVSILKIHSAGGRSKAFSTCASHLTVVLLIYGTSMIMYMGQTKSFSSNLKYIALIYVLVTPVLNPLIYSLRNNEVKKAFRTILTKYSSSRIVQSFHNAS